MRGTNKIRYAFLASVLYTEVSAYLIILILIIRRRKRKRITTTTITTPWSRVILEKLIDIRNFCRILTMVY
jgi:hypothetical protein